MILSNNYISNIFQLLNADNIMSANKYLAHAIGLHESHVFSSLLAKHYYYSSRDMLDNEGFFFSTMDDLLLSTTLSRKQQDLSIKNLESLGLIEYTLKGIPAKRHFRINNDLELLSSLLKKGEECCHEILNKQRKTQFAPNGQTGLSQTDNQDCPKKSNLIAPKRQAGLPQTDNHTYIKIKKDKIKESNQSNQLKKDMIDKIEIYTTIIKENIDYDYLINQYDNQMIDEIVTLMIEVILSEKDYTRIAKEDMFTEIVKSRFLKLNSDHIEYVLDCLKKNTTKVGNIKNYLLTALFNSAATINNYFRAEVNHDLYGEK